MCAGPDADVSGKGARALDGRTQSALPALAGNPTPPAPPPNPSQNNPDARAGNDPTRARRSPPERSALTDAYSSFRANAISSLPGRARCSPASTRPRRQSQTSRLGLEEERAASSVQKGGKSGRSPRVDGGSDSDSLTFECPTDTPHKRRRARSPSDTDTDDDVRSPLKRRSGARTLTASQYKPPPRVDETTTEPLKDFGAGHCSMDFASLLNILDDPKDGVSAAADASLSRQNSCSLADDTCMDADVDHLMCDVVSDCLDSHPDRSASHRMEVGARLASTAAPTRTRSRSSVPPTRRTSAGARDRRPIPTPTMTSGPRSSDAPARGRSPRLSTNHRRESTRRRRSL